jgi:hypothetical protein
VPKAKSAKKSVSKKKATKLPQAPTEHVFVLIDGRALQDYKALADALDDMEDHVYAHHVNWERNDFAYWVADTLQDAALAEKIRSATNKQHMQVVIYRHILERIA